MFKIKNLKYHKKKQYLYIIAALSIITVVSLLIGFADVLVSKGGVVAPLVVDDIQTDSIEVNAEKKVYFTLGSSKEEVLAAQGKPTNIVGSSWFYGGSRIDFKNDSVVAYSDRHEKLAIELKPQQPTDKKYFALGLTKDEVLAVQGKPSNIIGKSWYYGASKVEFDNGVVVSFSDRRRILNIKPQPER